MEQTKTNTALTYGLIGGIITIVYMLLLYIGGLEVYTGILAFGGYLIPIVTAVLGGIKEKKLQGGYLSFKAALKTVFLIFIIISLLSSIFNHLLLNVIDVPFREALMQDAGVKMEKMMTKLGAPQDTIDKALNDLNNPDNYSFGKIMLGFLWGAIVWFIVSLIIAAIIKKKRPEFENQI
ncbi:MAG: DUF4199 domain-containing protein [Chitinophagaceae bacterium]|nr:MAG: DUF4199 domain-containing protein [Chitinophagaceae bacterium]